MIKVLLADDHSIVRAGLRRIVEESGEMEVVAEASDGKEALQLVRKAGPDVAVAQHHGFTGSNIDAGGLVLDVLVVGVDDDLHFCVGGSMASFGQFSVNQLIG